MREAAVAPPAEPAGPELRLVPAGEGLAGTALLMAGDLETSLAVLGQRANVAGAARAAGKGARVRTLEAGCRYLAPAEAGPVGVMAQPLRRGGETELWRAELRCGARLAAEVTQTLVVERSAPPPALAVPPEPQGATADLRRKQIFRAACEVISRKGYDKASVREIAAAAGLPIPTLYLYVRNKEDILHMITQGCMEDIFRDFRENLSAEGPASQKLARAIESYLRYVDRNRKYINLVYRETRSLSRENREKIFAIERDFARLWQEIIEEGARAGEFDVREPALAAEVVYFLCNVWSIRHWTVGRFDGALVREELTRFALRGLGKKGRKGNG